MLFYRCQALLVLTVCLLVNTVVYSIRRCRQGTCPDGQLCCTQDNATAVVDCCRGFEDKTYYNIAMITRKLSGLLILLLLFAVGYFIQRALCSKTRQLTPPQSGQPTVTASQEQLLESVTPDGFEDRREPAPHLPTYDECRRLPTYEETVRDGGTGRPGSSTGQQAT